MSNPLPYRVPPGDNLDYRNPANERVTYAMTYRDAVAIIADHGNKLSLEAMRLAAELFGVDYEDVMRDVDFEYCKNG